MRAILEREIENVPYSRRSSFLLEGEEENGLWGSFHFPPTRQPTPPHLQSYSKFINKLPRSLFQISLAIPLNSLLRAPRTSSPDNRELFSHNPRRFLTRKIQQHSPSILCPARPRWGSDEKLWNRKATISTDIERGTGCVREKAYLSDSRRQVSSPPPPPPVTSRPSNYHNLLTPPWTPSWKLFASSRS